MYLKYFIGFILSLLFFLSAFQNSFAEEKKAGSSATLLTQDKPLKYDTRVKILKEFLQSYNSPLAKNAETFIKAADENNLDFRLVAAISGVESTFAKELPENSHNAWGWGIYGNNTIYFPSYDEAIQTISKSLRKDYMDTWKAKDVYEIGRFYAESPTWAQRVMYFMNKIEELGSDKPSTTLSISL